MSTKQIRLFGVSVVVTIAVGVPAVLIAGCNDDNPPVGPGLSKTQVVYMWDAGDSRRYFALEPATGELDSFEVDSYAASGLSATPDGSRLYAAGDSCIAVIDLTTRAVIDVLPDIDFSNVLVSPNGQTAAILTDSLMILNTADHSMIYSGSSRPTGACYTLSGNRLYVVLRDTVTIVDLTGAPIATYHPINAPHGADIRVAPDEMTWFLYRHHIYHSSFAVYDVALDSMTFVQVLSPGRGEFELTLNGRYVYFTNQSASLLFPPPAPYTFARYDVQTAQLSEIQLGGDCTPGTGFDGMGTIAITPDGRWLVAVPRGGLGYMLTFDLLNQAMTDFQCLGNNKWFKNLTATVIP